ncbi:MAG: 50S ribosomal protein L30 [Thaumarchaeota archaeon]|jgi:large subunit ribosomal protein L30|nr:50S ribosomal protein L30 [Nitrososphaerota archaeon]
MSLLIAIRIKGTINVREDVKRTLEMLHLKRKFNATVLRDSPVVRGMLQKAKDYVVWQELPFEKAVELFQKRGRVSKRRRLTLEYLNSKGINSFETLVKLYDEGKIKLKLIGVKPYFGLPPPKKGIPRRKYTALELLERMTQNGN